MTSYIVTAVPTDEVNRHTQTVRCYTQSNSCVSGKESSLESLL